MYDNTSTNQHFFAPFSVHQLEGGDEVTLAGSARLVVAIDLLIYSNASDPVTADTRVRFYGNDGTAGAPGTLLWDSGTFDNVSFVAGLNTYTLSVPSVLVPDTFTWTLQITDYFGAGALGPALFDPPTIGSSGDYVWINDTWEKLNFIDPDGVIIDNFGARLAAPEPGTLLLLGSGLAGLGTLARRRRR